MLTKAQEAYLAGAPPSDPGIEELVRLGQDPAEIPELGYRSWRDFAKAELELKYKFTGKWLDGPQVHNLLEGLPLKPAFRVYLEESVLWLQAWTQPQEIGGGFQPGTRILVLRPNMDTNGTIHEIGHVGYVGWMYQRNDLQQVFMAALARYADWGKGWTGPWPRNTSSVWALIRGYVSGGWQEDSSWFDGFMEPWNPDEAFASTFSACMGNLALLPPNLRVYYRGLVGG